MEKPFFVIGSVRVGRSQSIGTYDGAERRTAIAKEAVTGPVELTPTGFTGDEQFHTHVHGGPDKAVHQYPAESYGFWRERHPEALERFVPGAFGENLSTTGVAEGDVCIGDVVRVGSVVFGTDAAARALRDTLKVVRNRGFCRGSAANPPLRLVLAGIGNRDGGCRRGSGTSRAPESCVECGSGAAALVGGSHEQRASHGTFGS